MKMKINEEMPMFYCRPDGMDVSNQLDICEYGGDCSNLVRNYTEEGDNEKKD